MNIFGKSLMLAVAAAAIGMASVSGASADDRWRHNGNWGHDGGYRHHGNSGLALGAGLLGGLLVGSALASGPTYYDEEYAPPPPPPPPYGYYAPRRAYYAAPPAPNYYRPAYAGLQPWSPQWARYCQNRYRTFDGRSGTFIGNDGAPHFCVAG